MKIAVIYTGEIRTLEKTLPYLKKNVLLGENVHIFATLQSNEDIEKTKITKILNQELKKNLKSLNWFTKNEFWLNIQNRLINNMHINENLKNYLRNSGSMIEYQQLQTSYEQLALYENINNIQYDYIIRCRTDTIFCKPIDFSWLNLSDKNIIDKVNFIYSHFGSNIKPEKLLTYFMATVLHKDLLENINNCMYDEEENPKEHQYLNKKDVYLSKFLHIFRNCKEAENQVNGFPIDLLKEYINKGMYILTIRKNLLYIVKREYFGLIPSLGSFYGSLNFFKNEYWWNAESQFRSACAYSQMSIFDYDTLLEEKSLYNYDENRYFDENMNLKNNNMLYCLIRY